MKLKTHVIEKLCVGGSILEMRVDGQDCRVDLIDFSYRLGTCTDEQRKNVRVVADGAGLYWPDIDEVLPVDMLADGTIESTLQCEKVEAYKTLLRRMM
jgi:hypothetical protein